MTIASANPPVVLAFSALDPSGASGIQSDIETAASLGCHCAPVPTSVLTDGDSKRADILPLDPTVVIEQARSILGEMEVRAVKIGFLGTQAIAEAVHSILRDFSRLPVVSQPDSSILDTNTPEYSEYIGAYANLILPATNIACMTLTEARAITRETDTIDTTAHALLTLGSQSALITGTERQKSHTKNSLFGNKGLLKEYSWQGQMPDCQGSSNTLNMGVASYLAHGFSDFQALEQAHNFTHKAMQAARYLGFGKPTPHRLFWADKNIGGTSESRTSQSSGTNNPKHH